MAPDVDELLDASAPTLREPAGMHAAVEELVVAARRAARLVRKRRRRAATIGMTSVLLAAGGTAAAATQGQWAPWARHPLSALTYKLPSGGTCEERIGNLGIAEPAAQTLVEGWLRSHPIAEIADVDAAIRQVRSNTEEWVNDDGTTTPVGYGTDHYDPDYEYTAAVGQALSTAIAAKLKSAGFTGYVDWHWSGQVHCNGHNKQPTIPWYSK